MKTSLRMATFLTSVGAGLEYYDFVIYAMMAPQLTALFFPDTIAYTSVMSSFVLFSIGYISRSFGGLFFGMLGDLFGRKKVVVFVMLLMASSTFTIGLLPVYSQIGITAGILLLILRVLQALSFGAELPGAITVVCEYSKEKQRSLTTGFVMASTGLGAAFASFILYLLSKYSVEGAFKEWSWRLPFLIGGILAIGSYFIRKYLQETPLFLGLKQKDRSGSVKDLFFLFFKGYRKQLFLGIGLTWFLSSLVIFCLYLPVFLSTHFHHKMEDIYFCITCSMIWSACLLPICGFITDKMDKARVFCSTVIAFLLLSVPLFQLVQLPSFWALIVFMNTIQTFIAFLTVSYFPLLCALFPTSVRFTGIAVCYNVTYSLVACMPMVASYVNSTQAWPVFIFLIISGLVSLCSFLYITKHHCMVTH